MLFLAINNIKSFKHFKMFKIFNKGKVLAFAGGHGDAQMSSESYVPIVPFNKQLTDVCDAQPAATVLELGESYDARMLWQVLQSIQSRQDNCEILLKVYGSIVRRLQMMAVSTRKEKSTAPRHHRALELPQNKARKSRERRRGLTRKVAVSSSKSDGQ